MNAKEIGEMPAYAHAQYNGLTQRQAYKIAAMQTAENSVSETSMSKTREMLGMGANDLYEFEVHYPRLVALMAGKYADAMLAEDSEHLGRQG